VALTSSDCTADRPHQAHYRTRHLARVAALRPSIIHPAVAVLVEPCRHVDPPAARQPDVSKPDRALAQGLERNRAWCNMVIRLSSSLQARCFQSAVGGANHGAGTEDSATARGGRAGGSFALPGPIAVPLPPCAIFQSCRRKRGGARHGEAAGGGAAVRAASCAELQIAAGGCAVLGAHQCDRHAYNPWPSIRCGWRSRAPPPRLSSSDHEAGITASGHHNPSQGRRHSPPFPPCGQMATTRWAHTCISISLMSRWFFHDAASQSAEKFGQIARATRQGHSSR